MIQATRGSEPEWPLIAVAPEEGAFLDRARHLGCEGLSLPFPAPFARFGEISAGGDRVGRGRAGIAALMYASRLRRTLHRLSPDIVHAHGIKMQVLSRWTAPAAAAVVWHAHDYLGGRQASVRALRASSGRCRVVVAPSQSVADDFRGYVPGEAPACVVHNALDLSRFTPEGARLDLDRLAGMIPEDYVVRMGLAATFARWKGHDVFLRALAQVNPGAPWRAYIIGGAVYRTQGSQWSLDELQEMAHRLGLSERVAFTGVIEDMPSALRSLDVVVHASTAPEPFGMVIAEAMACGRASIVSLAGGAAELVMPGRDAIGVPPGDASALARALESLMGDPARRMQLGREARASAERAFDARRLGPELRRVYEAASALN